MIVFYYDQHQKHKVLGDARSKEHVQGYAVS